MKTYSIVNKTNNNLYWSNEFGWCEEGFDLFSEEEREAFLLPSDFEWKLFHEEKEGGL